MNTAPEGIATPNSAPDGALPSTEPPTLQQSPPGTESAAAPPEGKEPEKKEPESPRESAVARALQQRERALIQRELAMKEQRSRDEADFGQRLQGEVQKAVQAAMGEFDRDPIEFAKRRGLDENALAGRLLNKNRETPEEIAKKALDRATALEKELHDRQQTDIKRNAEKEFVGFIKKNEEKYTHLVDEWTEEEIVAETYKVIGQLHARAAQEGRRPPQYTDDELAEYLDGVAKKRQSHREERRKSRTAPANGTETAAPDGTKAPAGREGKTAKPATTTLNGKMSPGGTAPAKDLLEMSEEELREEIEREVAKARAARGGKA